MASPSALSLSSGRLFISRICTDSVDKICANCCASSRLCGMVLVGSRRYTDGSQSRRRQSPQHREEEEDEEEANNRIKLVNLIKKK